jgi:hypothetical protein
MSAATSAGFAKRSKDIGLEEPEPIGVGDLFERFGADYDAGRFKNVATGDFYGRFTACSKIKGHGNDP